MTPIFDAMLRFFGEGATGNKIAYNNVTDVNDILFSAHKQGVWTVVYPVISKIADTSAYRMQFLAKIASAVRRSEFTLSVLSEAMSSGIKVCLLKGVTIARLYAESEYRISSDTDILINPSDETKILTILKNKGYTFEKRAKNDHHLKAYHPVGGLLEVHVSLYSEITEKLIFDSYKMYDEPWSEIEISGKRFYTLGINDTLNYLTAHYIKHFITGGASIRQMMDLLLYIQKNKDLIDFKKYEKLLHTLRYDKLIGAVKTIGSKYFGMDFEITDEQLADKILDDCETIGLFGSNSEAKGNIYKLYCTKRKTDSKLKTKYMFMMKNEQNIFNRLFPSKRVLIRKGYGYCSKKILLPVAWVHNLFDRILKKRSYKSNPEIKDDTLMMHREKLMTDLNMID